VARPKCRSIVLILPFGYYVRSAITALDDAQMIILVKATEARK
jgi:hypothetical protein